MKHSACFLNLKCIIVIYRYILCLTYFAQITFRKLTYLAYYVSGFPDSTVVKYLPAKAGDHLQCRRLGFNPWLEKIPCKRKWQSTQVFLPGKSHEQRSMVGYSPWGRKSQCSLAMELHHCVSLLFVAFHSNFGYYKWCCYEHFLYIKYYMYIIFLAKIEM